MVSGSLCCLISFLDMSYSVILVVRSSGPIGDNDLWHHQIGIFSQSQRGDPQSQLGRHPSKLGEPLRKLQCWEELRSNWVSLEAAGRALKTAGRASEPAGRAPKPAWRGRGGEGLEDERTDN